MAGYGKGSENCELVGTGCPNNDTVSNVIMFHTSFSAVLYS
jgi:hypothetical protein